MVNEIINLGKTLNSIEKTATAVSNIVNSDLAKEFYGDAVKPLVSGFGTTAQILIGYVNDRLSYHRASSQIISTEKLQMQQIERNENLQKRRSEALSRRIFGIPADKLVFPPDYVREPLLNALSYTYDSDILFDMFAALLASASNSDTMFDVHPSFIEIIKQLSPLDAGILYSLLIKEDQAMSVFDMSYSTYIQALIPDPTPKSKFIQRNIVAPLGSYDNYLLTAISLDNVERLGLIEFIMPTVESAETIEAEMEKVKAMHLYLKNKDKYPTNHFVVKDKDGRPHNEFSSLVLKAKIAQFTDYGRLFVSLCIAEKDHTTDEFDAV